VGDRVFERSINGLTIFVLLWIMLGIVSGVVDSELSEIMGLVGWWLGLTVLMLIYIVSLTVFHMYFGKGWKSFITGSSSFLALVGLWNILGVTFGITRWGWVIPSGLLVEILGLILLLHYWGKNYRTSV
jgi:hypothetical protein